MADPDATRREDGEREDDDDLDEVDEESLESFPASDPPSSSSPVR